MIRATTSPTTTGLRRYQGDGAFILFVHVTFQFMVSGTFQVYDSGGFYSDLEWSVFANDSQKKEFSLFFSKGIFSDSEGVLNVLDGSSVDPGDYITRREFGTGGR
jgi:hypothetical protein